MPFSNVETAKDAPVRPELPVTEQFNTFRIEMLGILAETPSLGICKDIIGCYIQSLNNLHFWYDKWDTYRDYSSVINASLALGRWGMATSLFCKMPGYECDENLQKVGKASEKMGSKMWGAVQMAAARLVPFEKE